MHELAPGYIQHIGILSFFTNYGFKVKLIYIIRNVEVVVKKVVIKVYQLKELYKQFLENITFFKVRMA